MTPAPDVHPKPMQQNRHRRTSVRRFLRNLLRPMHRNRNPPPGEPPLPAPNPLPEPPPPPTWTPKHAEHIPPMQHPTPSPTDSFAYTPEPGVRSLPGPAPVAPLDMRENPFQPISRVRGRPHPGVVPRPSAAGPPPPLRIHPEQTRVHPRNAVDLPLGGMYNHVWRSPQPLSVPHASAASQQARQDALVSALEQRAAGMYHPFHPAMGAFPARAYGQPSAVDHMVVDSGAGRAGVRNVRNVQNMTNSLTMHGVQRVPVPTIPALRQAHPEISDAPPINRVYTPQLSIRTPNMPMRAANMPIRAPNMPFPLPGNMPQPAQPSPLFDPSLLPASLPPHQLARIYGMLQRSTTTRAPPQSTSPKPLPSGKSRRAQKHRSQKSPRSARSRATRSLKGDHIFRMLTLSQAPSHWFGALEFTQTANGKPANLKVPVGAFLYTLSNKPPFTASLPESIKLGKDTARKFSDVVDTAVGGQFMIRISPVNDYGHTVGNTAYAGFVNDCLGGTCVHSVQLDTGNLLLFPVSFPQVGLSFVAVFASN